MPGPFDGLKRTSSGRAKEGASESDANFHARVGMQRFLKHQAPLLAAYAAGGGDPDDVGRSGELAEMTEHARVLAYRLAAVVEHRSVAEVRPIEARHFRAEAAAIVAAHWRSGRRLDVDALERDVSRALRDVAAKAPGFYLDDVDWQRIPEEASRIMAGFRTASRLALAVAETYDYRRDASVLAGELTALVVEQVEAFMASQAAAGLDAYSRHSLRQTVLRGHCDVLREIWRRRARAFLADVLRRPASERERMVAAADPVSEAAVEFAATSAAVSRLAADVADAVRRERETPQHPVAGPGS